MKFILGAYSQIPYASSSEDYERLLSVDIKPLLTLLYNNPDYRLLLRLGLNIYEYLEEEHPEINMLINDLCRKNQLELLTSSCYDTVLSLVPAPERTPSIEKTTTFLRKRFQKKSQGFWCYNQMFNPSFVSAMGLCDLNYIVISSYNYLLNSTIVSKPFYMDEMGKSTIIFPTDDRFSKIIAEFSKNRESSDRLLNEFEKLIDGTSNSLNTIMINLDQIVHLNCTAKIFDLFYSKWGNNCTLPSVFLKDHEITKSFYLPSGFYGRDFNPGKVSSINQLIIDSPMLNRHFSLLNVLRDASKDCKKNSDEKRHIDSLISKASSGTLCIPEYTYNYRIRSSVNKNLSEIESILEVLQLLPDEATIDADRIPLKVLASKNLICYLNSKGSVISRMNIVSSGFDIAFNNGDGLFSDLFRNAKTGKTTDLTGKRYEITSLDRKKQDFFAKCPTVEIEKARINITKRFKIRQNTLVVDIGIENIGSSVIKDYIYESNLNISLPVEDVTTLSQNNDVSDIPVSGNSMIVSSKKMPFSLSIFTSVESSFSKRDFTHKTETSAGYSDFYQYSQFKIQKEISINPLEEIHFTIAIKADKSTRR